MEWIFAALIIGAIIYVGLILIELTNYTMQMVPRIRQMDQRAEMLAESCNREAALSCEARDRATSAKISVSELTERITELRQHAQTEKVRKQRLEMETFKVRLRGRRAVAA